MMSFSVGKHFPPALVCSYNVDMVAGSASLRFGLPEFIFLPN